MKSDLPKVLHPVAGAPLVVHAMRAAGPLAPEARIVVAGHGADAVRAAVAAHDPEARVVIQSEQLGTAHAVDQARPALEGFAGDAIVLYGDTPFIRPETLEAMRAARAGGADVVVLGFEAADPGRYGRLVMRGDVLERIVEAKDATPDELAITLCNSGVICARSETLFELIARVGNDNASGEYYLTDIVGLAREAGLACTAVTCAEAETLGINSRVELARAEAIFQDRARHDAMTAGVTLTAPDTVFLSHDTVLEPDVTVEPHVVFGPGVTVRGGAVIRAFSHLEGAEVGAGAVIGPYARLRPGTELGAGTKVGNFVETKNARVETGAKINHLSYVGDARVGAAANIGAGTITCNYDGVMKHRTDIGAGVFVGSNSSLVAPVRLGEGAMIAAGSTITQDVEADALGVARARQANKPGLAARIRERLQALKAKTRN